MLSRCSPLFIDRNCDWIHGWFFSLSLSWNLPLKMQFNFSVLLGDDAITIGIVVTIRQKSRHLYLSLLKISAHTLYSLECEKKMSIVFWETEKKKELDWTALHSNQMSFHWNVHESHIIAIFRWIHYNCLKMYWKFVFGMKSFTSKHSSTLDSFQFFHSLSIFYSRWHSKC